MSVSYLNKPVTIFQRERAMRSWMKMLKGQRPWDKRRAKRCRRVLEGDVA